MKLRNKKTGEIFDWKEDIMPFGLGIPQPKSLAELNEEWEDVPEEEWRDVLGFEELYQVSNLGNVRTVKRGEATVMAQEKQQNGYLSVHLRNRGIERRASVHRLVAEAFIPNPDGLRDVNHKNGIKTDNRLENLEWMSHSDNIKHQYQVLKTGRYGHLYKLAEPLIKDEKVRKAVRAWAEAIGASKVCILDSRHDYLKITDSTTFSYICFDYEIGYTYDECDYTIAELCGEEA